MCTSCSQMRVFKIVRHWSTEEVWVRRRIYRGSGRCVFAFVQDKVESKRNLDLDSIVK